MIEINTKEYIKNKKKKIEQLRIVNGEDILLLLLSLPSQNSLSLLKN
jgi:hypothetical protein